MSCATQGGIGQIARKCPATETARRQRSRSGPPAQPGLPLHADGSRNPDRRLHLPVPESARAANQLRAPAAAARVAARFRLAEINQLWICLAVRKMAVIDTRYDPITTVKDIGAPIRIKDRSTDMYIPNSTFHRFMPDSTMTIPAHRPTIRPSCSRSSCWPIHVA